MQPEQSKSEGGAPISSSALLGHGVQHEGYPKGWMRVVLMVSPDGTEAHAIGGDGYPPSLNESFYFGFEHVKKWLHAYNHPPLPWWRKDKHGWPVETFKGKPVKSAVRIICQNIRKVTG